MIHEVKVLDSGFEYAGDNYPSLSKVARAIAGGLLEEVQVNVQRLAHEEVHIERAPVAQVSRQRSPTGQVTRGHGLENLRNRSLQGSKMPGEGIHSPSTPPTARPGIADCDPTQDSKSPIPLPLPRAR